MIFTILLVITSLVAVLPVIWPLLRRRSTAGLSDAESRLAVQRDRRREIDREEAAGRLWPEEAERLRNELVESLAGELRAAEAESSRTPARVSRGDSRRTLSAVALAVMIPVTAYGVYRTVGSPEIGVFLSQNDPNAPVTEEDIRGMVADLLKRTEADPNNGEAWLMLAQTYRALDELGPAVQAYARAIPLLPPNARLLADQAETLALSRGRDFGPEPRQLLQQALRIDPSDPKSNALMAAVELQAGNRTAALPFLRFVLASLEPGSEQAGQITQLIDNIGGPGAAQVAPGAPAGSAANEAAPTGSAPPGSAPPGPAQTGPSGQAPTATANAGGAPANPAPAPDASAAGGRIDGRIMLAGGPPPPNAVLFISARSPSGPRMPYAALRIPDPVFPFEFTLSDANAMSPQRLLSGAGTVVVEARLSVSGTAGRQSGDRFGESAPVEPSGSASIGNLVIDRTVP